MNDNKIHRASDAFYQSVEGELKKLGLSTNLSTSECEIINDFANLDFGCEPCAALIRDERTKKNDVTNLSAVYNSGHPGGNISTAQFSAKDMSFKFPTN